MYLAAGGTYPQAHILNSEQYTQYLLPVGDPRLPAASGCMRTLLTKEYFHLHLPPDSVLLQTHAQGVLVREFRLIQMELALVRDSQLNWPRESWVRTPCFLLYPYTLSALIMAKARCIVGRICAVEH